MFAALARIILKSRIEKETISRKKGFVAWDKIEKMAFIFEHDDKINKSLLDSFIETSGKYVEVFYVETNSKVNSFADWHCFTRKETTFLKLPKPTRLNEFKSKNFEVLINTCTSQNLFATALFSSLQATLKVGTSGKFGETDLIISRTENTDLLAYLKVVDSYLKMIKV